MTEKTSHSLINTLRNDKIWIIGAFKASPRHVNEASHTENTSAGGNSLNKQFWATLEGKVDSRHCRKTSAKVPETSIEKSWLYLRTKGQEEAVKSVPEPHRNETLTAQIQTENEYAVTEQNNKINRTGRRNRGNKSAANAYANLHQPASWCSMNTLNLSLRPRLNGAEQRNQIKHLRWAPHCFNNWCAIY